MQKQMYILLIVNSSFSVRNTMAENVMYMEVEDIMCDQGILSMELSVDFQNQSSAIAVSAT